MSNAATALVKAFRQANYITSKFFSDNPDAYEETLDQLLIHHLSRAIRRQRRTNFPDGSTLSCSARYTGRRAMVHWKGLRREVADVIIFLRVTHKAVTTPKVLMLQSKRLFQTRGRPPSGFTPPHANPGIFEEVRNFIASELATGRSTFACKNKYQALSTKSEQWKAIEAINFAAREHSNLDLIYYEFQNPAEWPACSLQKPGHFGELRFRVLSQSEIKGTGLCSSLSNEFLGDTSLIEEWIAKAVECEIGYSDLGSDRLRFIITQKQRKEHEEYFDRKISKIDMKLAWKELQEAILTNNMPFSKQNPAYLDFSRSSHVFIDVNDEASHD